MITGGNKVPVTGEKGDTGKSAYELAVENGYTGTLTEWLASLNGTNGVDGKSAYEQAVDNGYTSTEAEWLASLQGTRGATPKVAIGSDGYWYVSTDGTATGTPDSRGGITDIGLSNNPNFTLLALTGHPLTQLDLSNNKKIMSLNSIDLTGRSSLKDLRIDATNIQHLDLSGCSALEYCVDTT